MEQARARAFLTKILWVLMTVGFVVLVAWGVLYSSALANSQFIMLLRNSYFDRLGTLLPGKPVYGLRPTAVNGEDIYTYKLAGRVVSMDYKERVMTLRDIWGREWSVLFAVTPIAGGRSKLVVNQATIRASGENSQQLTDIIIDPSAPDDTEGILTHEMVIVRWQDGRKVRMIDKVIVLRNDKVVPILRVVVEGTQ